MGTAVITESSEKTICIWLNAARKLEGVTREL
jgi:hypothetical protein